MTTPDRPFEIRSIADPGDDHRLIVVEEHCVLGHWVFGFFDDPGLDWVVTPKGDVVFTYQHTGECPLGVPDALWTLVTSEDTGTSFPT